MAQTWRLPVACMLGCLAAILIVRCLNKQENGSVLYGSASLQLNFERLERRLAALSSRDKEEWQGIRAVATRESEKGMEIQSTLNEEKRHIRRMLARLSKSVDREAARHLKDDRRLSQTFQRSISKAIARTSLALKLVDTRLSKYAETTKSSLSDQLAAVLAIRKKLRMRLKELTRNLMERELQNIDAAKNKDEGDEAKEAQAFDKIIHDAKEQSEQIVGSHSKIRNKIHQVKRELDMKEDQILGGIDSLNASLIDVKRNDDKKFLSLQQEFRESKMKLMNMRNRIKALEGNYTSTAKHVSSSLDLIRRQLELSTSQLQLQIHDLNSNVSTDTQSVSSLLNELKESRDTEEERLRQQIDEDRDAGAKELKDLSNKVDYVKNQQNEWTSKSMKSMQDAVNENREMKHHEDDIVNELRGKITAVEKSSQEFNATASLQFDSRWKDLQAQFQRTNSSVSAALVKARSQAESLSAKLHEMIQESRAELEDLKNQGDVERGSIEKQLNSTISTAINLLVAYENGVSALESGSFN
uniref:Uncharacterized protein n=1 Tax=Guillardia theta TaxID=55529 RepID=A0A7S4LZ93_GUITH|mmetsp:Transcript_10329/g.34471  ORF Transcript_10329/g.34471 Transcript_10329/m.34471 type:complete len:529 (+) Transcript_10329:83-1669(+)